MDQTAFPQFMFLVKMPGDGSLGGSYGGMFDTVSTWRSRNLGVGLRNKVLHQIPPSMTISRYYHSTDLCFDEHNLHCEPTVCFRFVSLQPDVLFRNVRASFS